MDKKYSAMKYNAYSLMIRHLLHLYIIHLGIRYNSFYILDNRWQIYHRAGSLLPFSGENHKFLQLYFISDSNSELNARCEISQLQHLFHENNDLVCLFKTAIDLMPTDMHKIVISTDKTLTGEQVRRYNAPTIDESIPRYRHVPDPT